VDGLRLGRGGVLLHHCDEQVSASTSLRFHVLEIGAGCVVRIALIPIFGLSVPHLVLYDSILVPVSLFHHGNVRMFAALDRWLRGLLVTPRMHWVHHAKRLPTRTTPRFSRFGDRLFGSYRFDPPGTYEIGLDTVPAESSRTLRQMLLLPFRPARSPRRPQRRGTRRSVRTRRRTSFPSRSAVS